MVSGIQVAHLLAHCVLISSLALGWEFQFLVPISGTPIGGGIPIPFTIPKIPDGFFLKFRFLESQKIGIPICNFRNSNNFLHRNSIHLFVANLY